MLPELKEKNGFSNCLPDYRIELFVEDFSGGWVKDLTVVTFTDLDSTDDLAPFLNTTLKSVCFEEKAHKWDIGDM